MRNLASILRVICLGLFILAGCQGDPGPLFPADAGSDGAIAPTIVVGKITGNTREDGTQATFLVVLTTKPSADVIVNLDSNDKTEGTVDKTKLTFTGVNWNAPQTVMVTGVNDDLRDGSQTYAIVFSAATSADPAYAGQRPASVIVVNIDNDTAGITVGAISGHTSEAGAKATFTIVLNFQPGASVTVRCDSNDKTEGVVDATSVTFTVNNWNAPQTVTVTGVDDDLADGDQPYSIIFSATSSPDTAYAGITPEAVRVINDDDDTPGITLSAVNGSTGENGAQATFTVVLNSRPTADVTVHLESSDRGEGTIDRATLTFTPINWIAPQTITITGVNDDLADGNQLYAIVVTATTSTDTNYSATAPASVIVINIDDDGANIAVGAISGNTGEDGTQATFTLALTSRPSADVTVHFDSNDTGEGTVDRTSVTFTPANWNSPQTVTMTGVNDALVDGNQPYAIVFAPTTSGDAAYAALVPARIVVTNVDDDGANVAVSLISGRTGENGAQATFTVVLSSRPTASVSVHFDSNDSGEGTVDRTSLTFTPVNWNAPQTVTVTGVNDDLADGNQTYSIVFSGTTTTDPDYVVITPRNVAVVNVDDDTAGISVSGISGRTGENGAQAIFAVVLDSRPTANVTVHFDSDNRAEGVVDRGSLTFTPVNWNAPQTVVVTGVNDDLADGIQPYSIVFSATASTDPAYAAITPASVAVRNVDDDTAGFTVSPISGPTSENGTQATFTVALNAQPTAGVTIAFDSDDTGEGTLGVTSLTFTTVNWNAPQTVVVTGINDDLADGNQPYDIVFAATTSFDAAYAAIRPVGFAMSNVDNDTAGITVSAISRTTSEELTQATFTVVLNSQPTATVSVNFDSDNRAEGKVDRTSLTFTAVNWRAAQTVTVTGVDDDLADGTQPYSIAFSATASNDAAYAAITPGNVAVKNTDNDTAGISVSLISGSTTESGGQATFTVVLNSEPFTDVIVHLDSNDPTEGTVDQTSLVFTTVNWHAPQVVTVTGVDDQLADRNQAYAIAFTSTTTEDGAYAAITPANVAVRNTDNDTAAIMVSAVSGNTSEAGGQATFTVRLTSQPFADVTVSFHSNDITEGTLGSTSLTFSGASWPTPQTVTITGVDDNQADGNQPYAVVFAATTSIDPAYAVITPANVAVTNTDNDTAGFTVSSISDDTSEDGAQGTFTVRLNSQPFADVTVHFDSDDTSEGTLDKTSLTFTTADWSTAQTVTATGQNDSQVDGNQLYGVVFTATTSDGARDLTYEGITPSTVTITNVDNDHSPAGILVSAISGTTSEGGGKATFTVQLNSPPAGEVTVHFDSDNMAEGMLDQISLTFTSANWNVVRTVTVTGQDDTVRDCDAAYAVVFTATTTTSGSDSDYAAITPSKVAITNLDDETGAGSGWCLSWTSDQFANASTCQPWLDFTAGLGGNFSSISMSGSANPAGKTCSNAAAATSICNALNSGSEVTVMCGADTWQVGGCGNDVNGVSAMEVGVNVSGICQCDSDANTFIVRPCIDADSNGNPNVGGIGTDTCGTPTQTMLVNCTR